MSAETRARRGDAGVAFVGAGLAIAVLSTIAWIAKLPFIFPSLGATAYLSFVVPRPPGSFPVNILVGHVVGLVAGLSALVLFDLRDHPAALIEGVSPARIGATSLAVATTAGILVWTQRHHPPAGATALIVSLGLLRTNHDLVVMFAAVLIMTITLELLHWGSASLFRSRAPSPSEGGG